jgi:hypothetical protein
MARSARLLETLLAKAKPVQLETLLAQSNLETCLAQSSSAPGLLGPATNLACQVRTVQPRQKNLMGDILFLVEMTEEIVL